MQWVFPNTGGVPGGAAGGSLTGTYPDPGIADGAVGNSQLTEMAADTMKGNNSGVTAAPGDLSISQVFSLLGLGTAATEALSTDNAFLSPSSGKVPSQLAVYNYVQLIAAGLTPNLPVDVATTSVLPAGIYNNGTAGVGATFTVTATGIVTIDSVQLTVLGKRVLVKNQASALQNGVYTVTTASAVGVSLVLTRATDSNTGTALQGASYEVTGGSTQVGEFWNCTNATNPVIGTDAINFAQFTVVTPGQGVAALIFSTGLLKSGNTVTVSAVLQALNTVFSATATAAAQRTALGVAIGTNVEAWNALLDSYVSAGASLSTDGTFASPSNILYPSSQAVVTYVQGLLQGLSIKASVRLASTADLGTVVYSNGASGVGATLSGTAGGGGLTIDSVVVNINDRVLIKNQTSALQNGIYTCTTAGISYVLTRTTDSNTSAELIGAFTFVEAGTLNAASGYVCTNNSAITIGTTAINYTQFNGAGAVSAGNGIAITGNSIAVNPDGSTLDNGGAGNTVEIKAGGVNTTQLATAAVTLATMANLAANSIIGNNTGSPATPVALTAAQVKTLLAIANTDVSGLGTASTQNTGTANGTVATNGLTVNAQSGTTYTFVLTDANKQISGSNASATTFTVPPNSSVAFAINDCIEVQQLGAGQITIAAGAGVTINSTSGLLTVPGQYASIFLQKTATDTWELTGNGLLQVGNNLSDLASASTARTNLGVQPTASPTFTGTTTAPEFSASGLTGAVTASRWVGAVAGAAPTSGAFSVGDCVIDTTLGGWWTCTVAGTSGTWIYSGPSVVKNVQTGTSYTLVLADAGFLITMNNASASTLTIPANASVAFPVGTVINALQLGAGQVTVGITTDALNGANGLKIAKQYSMISLTKYLSTTWVMTGDTST